MKTKTHIFLTTFLCMIICLIKPEISLLNLSLIWFSGWLFPDLDHYISYIIKNKKINPIKFYKYSMQKRENWKKLTKIQKQQYRKNIMPLHSIEFIIILATILIFFPTTIYLIIGFLFHLTLDIIDFYNRKENILIKISLIYTIKTNKNKKNYSK